MFAVIKTGGRQYRVVPDDVLEIGKIAGDVGTIVQLGEVLLVGGESPVLGAPTERGPKVISFKKRRRKNSRRKRGYRDEITVLRITEILTNDNKPTIGPRPKREKPVVAAPVDGDDEAPRPAKKKAPAKKAKAPAKAAAKPRAKPAAKKAPAKKRRPKE